MDMIQLQPYSNPKESWEHITQEEIEMLIINVMSYTRHVCRKEFIAEQVRKMRKAFENNKDLRRTIIGLSMNIKMEILDNLKEIEEHGDIE